MKIKIVRVFTSNIMNILLKNNTRYLKKYYIAMGLIAVTSGLMIVPSAVAQDNRPEVVLDEVVVVASKHPALLQDVPASVSAFNRKAMDDAGITLIGDAAEYVPNVNMVEFTERVLSQPYFRGIGSGPNNPAVTTYLDGVPQLHGYSSNVELLDINQVEFVRGSQGMLYGRNTVGGVIHILSKSPNLSSWEYSLVGEYGSYDLMRGSVRFSGPLVQEKLGLSLAAGYSSRDGFSENDTTGNDIDNREAFFSKLQLEWLPTDALTARFILFAEKDSDGDYALHDLTALRANPYHGQRDFEGYLDRDIFAPTLSLEYSGDRVDFISTTGLVKWETQSETDLDYTPFPASQRESNIRDLQISQEFQWRSAEDSPLVLNDHMKLAWQAGTLFFMQDYREISINKLSFPVQIDMTSPLARLEDTGLGAYAQAILTAWDVWDMALGLRFDYEKKEADLKTFSNPAYTVPSALNTDRDFTEISPQFSLTRRIAQGRMIYGSVNRGYRAGGFNPVSPEGREAYDEETSWNYEIGAKTTWLDERLKINLAVFHIDWNHLQLNLPYGQSYYIFNAGDAESTGIELEVSARPLSNWDIFGSIGYDRARYGDGSTSIRTDVFGNNTEEEIDGNDLIFTPEFTANAGTQYSWELGTDARIFVRAEVFGYGSYFYNTANTQSQDSYWLTNLRAGYRTSNWFAEVWAKNIFDTVYIPVAFEFPNQQSGFIGENGAPRMFGLRTGFTF